MKNKLIYLAFLMLFFACGLRDQGPQQVSIRGVVFGTYYSVIYYEGDGRVLQQGIDSLFGDFNSSLSFYDQESLLSRINRNEEKYADDHFRVVFERAQQLWKETGGAFDATVFPLVNAWGFGYADRVHMTPGKVDSLLEFVGFEKIWTENGRVLKDDERVQLDFNALAKGYAADLVGTYLESKGIHTYLVEIGGDLVVKGVKPDGSMWRIGLEIPAENMTAEQQWDYLVEIRDIGLATSGDYRRYQEVDGQRYSHTINPETGYPVMHNLLSASVFAPDGMSADAYATAFMTMGLEAAIDFVEGRDDLEAYFIFSEDGGYGYYATDGLTLLTRDDL